LLGHTTTEGAPELRTAIAARYERLVAADDIVAAPQEATFLAATALVKPGDRVIVTWPRLPARDCARCGRAGVEVGAGARRACERGAALCRR
jgi:aspartate/methionine/tyrosine aminotransferase